MDPRFSEAEAALEAGQFDLAAKRYQAILDAEPANTEAALALRQVRLLERLQDIDPKLVARAETAPDDVPAQLAAADYALSRSDVDGALGRLLGLVRRVSGADRDAVRERLIEYFDLLGPDDPRCRTRAARPRQRFVLKLRAARGRQVSGLELSQPLSSRCAA